MISFILALFVIGFYFDFRKTFIILIVYSTLLMQFSVSISFMESLFYEVSAIGIFFFLLNQEVYPFRDFPIKNSILLLIVSQLITFFFNPFSVGVIIRNLILYADLFILYCLLRRQPNETLYFFFTNLLIFGTFIGLYGIYETITESNPYMDFINHSKLYIRDFYIKEIRFGFKRSQTFFSMHTTNACVVMMISVALLCGKKFNTGLMRSIKFTVIFLCVGILFLSGARSAMVGFVITFLAFTNPKSNTIRFAFPVIIIYIYFMNEVNDYFYEVLQSLVRTDYVAGSSSDMRDDQFRISNMLMMRSPIYGNGMGFTWSIVSKYNLMGAESIWFPLMIDHGFIGVISHLFFFSECAYYCYKNKMPSIIFVVLGFVVFNTLSSIPQFPSVFLFVYLLIIIESNKLYDRTHYKDRLQKIVDRLIKNERVVTLKDTHF